MTGGSARLLIDGHVHYHRDFPPAEFVRGLTENMAGERRTHGVDTVACAWLLAVGQDDPMARLAADLPSLDDGRWRLEPTTESWSFVLTGPDEPSVHIITGRQIRTRENLEVLAIGPAASAADGAPVSDLLDELARSDATAILPWGVGKWWGNRGAIVDRLIAARRAPWYVGDNGNRPGFWPRPGALVRAEAAGAWDLPGSDPLPHPAHAGRAGSFGFVLPAPWDPSAPFASVRAGLHRLQHGPVRFGALARALPFIGIHAVVQGRKWLGRRD